LLKGLRGLRELMKLMGVEGVFGEFYGIYGVYGIYGIYRVFLEFALVDVLGEFAAEFGETGGDGGVVHVVVELHGEAADDAGIRLGLEFHLLVGEIADGLGDEVHGLLVGGLGGGEAREYDAATLAVEVEVHGADALEIDRAFLADDEEEERHGGLAHMLAEEGGEDGRLPAGVDLGIVEDGVQLAVLGTDLVHQPHVVADALLLVGVLSKLEKSLGVVDINTVVLHLILV